MICVLAPAVLDQTRLLVREPCWLAAEHRVQAPAGGSGRSAAEFVLCWPHLRCVGHRCKRLLTPALTAVVIPIQAEHVATRPHQRAPAPELACRSGASAFSFLSCAHR